MEYMSTYIYAGLALVVVVGTMGYFGAFEKDTYTEEKCESGKQMSCADATITADGVIKLMFNNHVGRMINVTNVTVTYHEQELATSPDRMVSQRENATFLIPSGFSFEEGNKEEFSYTITYTPMGSPRNYTIRGVATAKVDPPVTVCGNGLVESGEECDYAADTQSRPCSEYDEMLVGTMTCSEDCTWDQSSCTECTNWAEDGWTGDYNGECCRDGEYFVVASSLDDTDDACCEDYNACVHHGSCYSEGDKITATIDNDQEMMFNCTPHGWQQVDFHPETWSVQFKASTGADAADPYMMVDITSAGTSEPHEEQVSSESAIYTWNVHDGPVTDVSITWRGEGAMLSVSNLRINGATVNTLYACSSENEDAILETNHISLGGGLSVTCSSQ